MSSSTESMTLHSTYMYHMLQVLDKGEYRKPFLINTDKGLSRKLDKWKFIYTLLDRPQFRTIIVYLYCTIIGVCFGCRIKQKCSSDCTITVFFLCRAVCGGLPHADLDCAEAKANRQQLLWQKHLTLMGSSGLDSIGSTIINRCSPNGQSVNF